MHPSTAGSVLERAEALYREAVAHPGEAARGAPDVIEEARRAGSAEALVVALRARAWCERRDSPGEASRSLREAATIARRHGLAERLAEVLTSRAAVNQELGRTAASRRDLDAAATLLGSRRSVELDLQRAVLLHNAGRLADAVTLYQSVLADASASPVIRAKVGNNLAHARVLLGQLDRALEDLLRAVPDAEAAGPALVAYIEHMRGWVTVLSGRPVEGVAVLERAGKLHDAAGLPKASHLIEYADALVELRLLPEAATALGRAVDGLEAGGVPLVAAEARLRLSRVALLRRDLDRAEDEATRAGDAFRQQRRPSWAAAAAVVVVEAALERGDATPALLRTARAAARSLEAASMRAWSVDAHLVAGRVAAAVGQSSVAAADLRRAAELARTGPVLLRLKGRLASALAASAREDRRAVLSAARWGLLDLARHRAALGSIELRALASGHGAELGRLGLDAGVAAGPAAALTWMERTRSAALLSFAPLDGGEVGEELGQLRSLRSALVEERQSSGREPTDLLARQAAVEARIRRATWARPGGPTAASVVVSAAGVRERLGDAVLVEYAVRRSALVAVVLGAGRSRVVDCGPLSRVLDSARALLFALRRMGRPGWPARPGARASAEAALAELSTAQVRPLRLPPARPVVVVPSSQTFGLPWSSLLDVPVTVAPSATAWARSVDAEDTAGSVVLVAGPGLEGAVDEVRRLGACHRDAVVLSPPASTVDAVSRVLAGARLAHFACHAELRSDSPLFSALVLADGGLTVHEINAGFAPPNRIVLSACDSGADASYDGEELLGFASALMARGSRSVLASVVAVSDLDVVPVMVMLHERLLAGDTMARALHAARARIDRDLPGGFAMWCAFNAYGGG